MFELERGEGFPVPVDVEDDELELKDEEEGVLELDEEKGKEAEINGSFREAALSARKSPIKEGIIEEPKDLPFKNEPSLIQKIFGSRK